MRKEEYRPHGRNRGVRQAQANAKWPLGVSLRNRILITSREIKIVV